MMNRELSELKSFSSRDFLTWDEKSMRALLIKQLSKSGAYTDQIYPGSDLSVLIDITAYAFAMMTYIANNNASEATFADAQFYENVNRLCRMLGYKPKGFSTAYAPFSIRIDPERYSAKFGSTVYSMVRNIPRYSRVTHGGKVYSIASGEAGEGYSNYQSFAFTVDMLSGVPVVTVEDNPVFLNGTWKLYGVTPVSAGAISESYVLEDVDGDIAYPFVDVYVYSPDTGTYERWVPVSDLYSSTPTDKSYSIRINERKKCEIEFGDGVNGMRLKEGQILYFIYLQSQGEEGKIEAGEFDGSDRIEVAVEGMTSDDLRNVCFGGKESFNNMYGMFSTVGSVIYSDMMFVSNVTSSVDPVDYETVESIRVNAPNAFKSGNRLVTKSDYESFIMSNYSAQIRDCYVMNNFAYCAEFQNYILEHWVDENGEKLPGNPMIKIRQYNYRYSDACDHNNVYIWLHSTSNGNTSEFVKRAILNDTMKLKCIGAEPIPMDAMTCVFAPYAGGSFSVTNWDTYKTNRIVVVKDQSSLVSNDRVKENVVNAIVSFFGNDVQRIGGTVDIAKLYSDIISMDGVKDVYTAYVVGGMEKKKVDGLSFARWTPLIIKGVDRSVSVNSPIKMMNFQYAALRDPSGIQSIVDVRSNSSYISSPEY